MPGLNNAAHSLIIGTFLKLGQSLTGSSSPILPEVTLIAGEEVVPDRLLEDLRPPPPSMPVFSTVPREPVLSTATCILLMIATRCHSEKAGRISLLFTNLDLITVSRHSASLILLMLFGSRHPWYARAPFMQLCSPSLWAQFLLIHISRWVFFLLPVSHFKYPANRTLS